MHFLYFGHAFSTADGDEGERRAEGRDERPHGVDRAPAVTVAQSTGGGAGKRGAEIDEAVDQACDKSDAPGAFILHWDERVYHGVDAVARGAAQPKQQCTRGGRGGEPEQAGHERADEQENADCAASIAAEQTVAPADKHDAENVQRRDDKRKERRAERKTAAAGRENGRSPGDDAVAHKAVADAAEQQRRKTRAANKRPERHRRGRSGACLSVSTVNRLTAKSSKDKNTGDGHHKGGDQERVPPVQNGGKCTGYRPRNEVTENYGDG